MIDTSSVKTRLQGMLTEIVRRHDKIEAHIVRDEPLPADFAEQESERELVEVIDQLDEKARAEIAAIRHALLRLGAGSYGNCERCSEPIDEARLAVLPTAATCMSCAEV